MSTRLLVSVVGLIYSALFFALSSFAYLNLELMPHIENSFVAIVIGVAIGSGVLQFPMALMMFIVNLFDKE